MAELRSLDPNAPLFAQLREETGEIVLVNTFVVPEERAEEFSVLFRRQAAFMRAQPGFVSLQLHRGVAGSRLLVNVAVWESTWALAAALGSPEFRRTAAGMPDDIVSYPHVFERIDA
ncbi:putative monooxygenase [Kitasatospora phosalacinea]|uniref:Monooxygenase n=1 Tax=Kitasatospora phosalacinea TaxID=2065 RepID=A0A9W6Q5Z8_9ACTN|nr:antibiotic biosynthesis monooxygenase family protein [Kitasatospora phosalacinea]GLW70540.1 putative monooxygenase [Kitasatospora phosalacinea]